MTAQRRQPAADHTATEHLTAETVERVDPAAELLYGSLEMAVPLWLDRHTDRERAWLLARARQLQELLCMADSLSYPTGTKTRRNEHGQVVSVSTRDAFNAVAEMLTIAVLVAPAGQEIEFGSAQFVARGPACGSVPRGGPA